MEKKLIRIGEAAKIVGVSESTLRRWEETGDLVPAKRNGLGNRYYNREEIERFSEAGPPVSHPKIRRLREQRLRNLVDKMQKVLAEMEDVVEFRN